jgi:lipopolysaccharide transport system permease protein
VTAREVVLELKGDRSRPVLRGLALRDVADGLRLWRLAVTLAWLDIKLRYRGSMLGPLWLTLSTAVMIGALGVLYAALFHMNVRDYLPFLALSQVLWAFLATLIADGCVCFTSSESLLLSIRMPLSVHALRVLVRGVLILAHNVIVIVGVYLIFSIWPGQVLPLAIPGLMLWAVDAFALALLLGAVGSRYRDIPPIVGSIVQIAFFVTPVMWKPEQLGQRAWILPYNPFFSLLEIVRAPLLGYLPSLTVWGMALLYSVVLLAFSWWLFTRARGRVAFWL